MSDRARKQRKTQLDGREGIDPLQLVKLFYGLEALKCAVIFHEDYEPLRHSHERLVNDINDLQETIHAPMARMLYDYSVLACYGEMGHAGGRAAIKPANKLSNKSGDRYTIALQFNPKSILDVCENIFNAKWYESSFGGEAWYAISKVANRYGKISDMIYCDTIFSLSHNTGTFVNKNATRILKISSSALYRETLDAQAKFTPDVFIKKIIISVIDKSLYKLIMRAANLNFISLYFYTCNLSNKDIVNDILQYKPIKWGKRILTKQTRDGRTKNAQQEKFINDMEKGMKCILVNPLVYGMSDKDNTFDNLTISITHGHSSIIVHCNQKGGWKNTEIGVYPQDLIYLDWNLKRRIWPGRKMKETTEIIIKEGMAEGMGA